MDVVSRQFVHQLTSHPLYLLLPYLIGCICLLSHSASFLKWLYTAFLRAPKNLKACYGSWALITGATDGIGRALAFELAHQKLHLILAGRNPNKLNEVSTAIKAKFKEIKIKTVVVDLGGDMNSGARMIAEAVEGCDVGVLVNCAGEGESRLRYFSEMREDVWREDIKVNVVGTTMVTKVVLPGMLKRRRGAIVNIGSGASVIRPSPPLHSVYAATKAYVELFSRGLYVECKKKGIDVQCQIPLYVATKLAPSKKVSFFIPSPETYARAAVRWIGYEPFCMPYWPHNIQWFGSSLLPDTANAAWLLHAFALKEKIRRSKKD